MKKALSIISLACLMSGCGGNVKQDLSCHDQDWSEFGSKTAMAGQSVRTIDEYKDSCGSAFTQEDLDEYLDSYSRALIDYCTYENGYEHGSNDKKNSNICPHEIEAKYVEGYSDGRRDRFVKLQELEKIRDNREQEDMREGRKRNVDESTGPDVPGAGVVRSW